MDKFNFRNFDPTNADIAFSASNGYTEPNSELARRQQLSYPLKEVKTYLNNVTPTDDENNPVQLVVSENKLQYRSEPDGELTDAIAIVEPQAVDAEITLNAEFQVYTTGTVVRALKYGKIVSISGIVKPTVPIEPTSGDDIGTVMFTLPDDFKPTNRIFSACLAQSGARWMLNIETDGRVKVSRYTTSGQYETIPVGTWLPFHVTYIIGE